MVFQSYSSFPWLTVLGNIIDEQTGKPSYFTDQMTFETTLSDTHGSLDFQKLMQSGRQVRFLDEGILGHYFSLLDEQFDMRPNAFRNILTALAEGRYKGEIGKSWMIVGASNKSIPEVYARFNIYDDSARALIDRYAYVFYVGAELTMERNNVKIIQNGGQPPAPPPRLTVQDLEKLNALLKHVEIPLHVAHLLSYVDYQLKQMLEANESNSLTSYLEKLARGEPPSTPPWKSTKYMSPRTLGRSATILRAAIVRDWVEKGGRRDLVASVEDLQSLTSFFALNGPSEKDVMFLQTRTTKDTERDQLNTVQMERSIVQKLLEDAVGEFNRALETLSPLQDSLVKLRNRRAMKAPQKAELENEVKAHFLRAYAARKILDTAMRAELSPELIAQESILEVSYDVLKALNPDPDALNEKIKVWIQEMEKDPEAFARATPAPVAAPEVTVHPVKADQVDFVEMDSQAFQDNDVFGGEFLVSSDSRAFFALTSHGLNILTAGRATGGISWAGAMNPMSMTGKFILYRQDQNPIYSYNSDQPRFTEANPRQLFNPTQQNLFFADEARNQFLMVSSPVGQPNTVVRAFNPVDGRMTDLENVSLSAITDYDSSDLWQPAFSWQASTGAHFTLADHYRKLYKYQVGSGVVSPAPWADALNRQSLKMVGRYGDTIFLANPTHLIQLDPVAEKLTGKKIISNSFNPDLNTVWISKL
nr:hypothetical protein [Bdellovibrionales bacterium]